MVIFSEREQVKQAIRGWIAVYGLDKTYYFDNRGINVGHELLELNQETATAKDVAEIIGNSSWVSKLVCCECSKETYDVVKFVDQDCESVCVCFDCLRAALRLVESLS